MKKSLHFICLRGFNVARNIKRSLNVSPYKGKLSEPVPERRFGQNPAFEMAKAEPTFHDQTNILPTGRLIIIFSALASALLITFIDQQSIGVILPTIGRDLNSSSTITWAGTSSLIANTAFQVLYGRFDHTQLW